MSSSEQKNKPDKEAMKKLRERRKPYVKAATANMKKHKKAIKLIKEIMENQKMTIPEIALGTAMDASEVLWYVAALKKYGELVEAEKAGAFFKYQLVKT